MNLEREIEEIGQTLKILDVRVGEITRSIRAYVDYVVEKRMEEGFEEFQQSIGRRLSSMESRIESLEEDVEEKKGS